MTESKSRDNPSYLPRSYGKDLSDTKREEERAPSRQEDESSHATETTEESAAAEAADADERTPTPDKEPESPPPELSEPAAEVPDHDSPQAVDSESSEQPKALSFEEIGSDTIARKISDPAVPIADRRPAPPEPEIKGPQEQVLIKVRLVGIRFSCASKIYHFDAGDLDLQARDWVIVKTEKGVGLGHVALTPFEKEVDGEQLQKIRKVLRKARQVDFEQKERCWQREAEAYRFCQDRIDALELPMKLVSVECYFDGTKYVFYFTAEGRVDFRDLVKQLVARFPVRIEMRQIGVRHEAKMTGGLGCCGQELCCSRFLTDFRPVSVRMAKDQNLSLNPSKISGACGRLMCCLGYEHDIYQSFKKGLPKVGKVLNTSHGEATILKYNPLHETILVRTKDDKTVEITKADILSQPQPKKSQKADKAATEGKKPARQQRQKRREKKRQ